MSRTDDLQLSWLTSFLAVVDHGSFTAAAQAVHRSQPRVSSHVAALERALNVRLLDRDTRGVAITEAGNRLATHARAALAEVRAGMDSVESLAGELQGTVVVGSFPGASGVLLAPLIKRFRERHAGVSIELHEGDPGWLEDAVANVNVDMAIRTADVPQRHHNVDSRQLFQERVLLVTAPDDPLASTPGPDLSGPDQQVFVMTGAPAEGWTDFTDHLAAVGINPARIVTVAHPTTVIALVRAGIGVGLLGEMAATITAFGDVVTRELPDPLWRRGINVYWNSRRALSTAATAFLEALTADAAELSEAGMRDAKR